MTTAQNADLALQCAHLTKRYGTNLAVDDVSLEVLRGEAFGLLGPNGAGKSTTISMIVGLIRPDSGTVEVSGSDMWTNPNETKRRIGYVPQEVALYPELSARENLIFFGRLYGLRGRTLHSRIDEVLHLIGLTERGSDRVDTYSGGMKRRVNIAAALLHEPELIILDEPTVGVDPQSRDAILGGIENLLGTGVSLIYTSHYMEEVERICDRVAIVDKGRVIAEGTKAELVATVGRADKVELLLEGDVEAAVSRLETLDRVQQVGYHGGDRVNLFVTNSHDLLPEALLAIEDIARITSMKVDEPDLEDTFLHLTGTSLRD